MTRRSMVWLFVAVPFTFVNFVGGVFAAAQEEPIHAGIHAVLLLVGAYVAWRLAPIRYARRICPGGSVIAAQPRELIDSLTHLEQSVDAVAIEVERIGEGQRFMTGLFTENGAPRARGEGAAETIHIKAGETAPPS